MRRVYLVRRRSDEKQTLGAFVTEGGKEMFVCKTLELPWRDNENNVSCIPAGEYVCRYTASPHLHRSTYEVLDVPNRTGIRIHSANYFHELKGCIALGDAHKDINVDGELDVIHSGQTVFQFNQLMEYLDFTLVVEWALNL